MASKMSLNNLLTAALAVLALSSAGSIVLTTANCTQGVRAVPGVRRVRTILYGVCSMAFIAVLVSSSVLVLTALLNMVVLTD
jgi:hypothetical protein